MSAMRGGSGGVGGRQRRGHSRGRSPLAPILLLLVLMQGPLILASLPLAAQTITGRVTDRDSGDPLEGVRIQLLSVRRDSLAVGFTDRTGSYRLQAPGPGEYRIRADRVGVGEVETPPFRLREAGTEVVDLSLAFTAIELDPLLVRQRPFRWWERDKPDGHWEFWERREFYEPLGFGRFLSAPGLWRFRELQDVVALHAPIMLRCTGRVALYVDGLRMPGPSLAIVGGRLVGDGLDHLPMHQVENLELYPGGLRVPAELAGGGAPCGAVVVWRRVGGS